MRWAVLTGDIVGSSDIAPGDLDAVMARVTATPADVSTWGTPKTPIKTIVSRRGGDGWQLAISQPDLILRIALFVQAQVRSADAATRLAAATGTGHLPDTPNPDLNSAHGPVFQASGRLLEVLNSRTLMAHADGGALDAAFRLADHISQGWTQAQARALCLMLPPRAGPRRIAAKQLGISRQAVDQALHGAGYPALIDALNAIEGAET